MIKSKKPRNVRRARKDSSSDDDSELTSANLDGTRELHKLRKRSLGISAQKLASTDLIEKRRKANEESSKDPFKMESGGFIDMKSLKKRMVSEEDPDGEIGSGFAAETNKGDHDHDMMKYVESQLRLRQGYTTEESSESQADKSRIDALPDYLKTKPAEIVHRNEEMISSQMLTGIPEVDLGISAKIRNIEATEEAKLRMLKEARERRETVSDFVPTNVAVNFVQHNRFSILEMPSVDDVTSKKIELKRVAKVGERM